MNPLSLFLSAVPRAVLYCLIVALAGLTIGCGAQWLLASHRANSLEVAIAKQAEEWARARALQAEAARRSEEQQRIREQTLTARLQDAESQLEIQRESNRKLAASLSSARTERDGLRDQIAGFASGSGSATDTLAAARNRADKLGRLLADSLRVQEELAAGAESEAANVRSLLAAWPR